METINDLLKCKLKDGWNINTLRRGKRILKILEQKEINRDKLGYDLFRYDKAKEHFFRLESDEHGNYNCFFKFYYDNPIEKAMRKRLR